MLILASKPDSAVPVGEIEQAMDVPRQFAAKILQKLARAGLVESVRGVKGGFKIARSPEKVTLLDVFEASSGKLALNVCVANKKNCERSGFCPVHPIWIELTCDLAERMKSWSLAKVLRRDTGRKKAPKKKTKIAK
jgi:Rrf2 family protein